MTLPTQGAVAAQSRPRRSPFLLIDEALADGRLSLEALGAHVTLRRWALAGGSVSTARLARERLGGDHARAAELFAELASVILVEDADTDDLDELILAAEGPRPPAAYLPGQWGGARATPTADAPDKGVPIVYFLYDAADQLAYVGSTHDGFWRRAAQGHEDKPWVRWEARECADRRDAFELERREIAARQPYLNRTLPRQAADA